RGGDIDQALAVGVVAFDRSELGDEIVLAAHSLARNPGIEPIMTEAHRDRYPRLERNRLFQVSLAHVAPGANHVGNDFDRQWRHERSSMREESRLSLGLRQPWDRCRRAPPACSDCRTA